MPIAASDLKLYAAANTPENDTATAGGAIDEDVRLDFTQLAANDDLEVLSDNAGDTTQTATVWARSTAGAIVTEGVTLNGTTAVIYATIGVVERVLKFLLSADATGTVTLRRSVAGPTVRTVPPGERAFEILFYDSASESGVTDRYQKGFYLNDHATLTLNSAQVALTADPDAIVNFALATAKNDAETTTNRKTAPAAVSAFDDAAKNVPGTTLEAQSRIGVWWHMTLPASDAPHRTTITSQLSGTSV